MSTKIEQIEKALEQACRIDELADHPHFISTVLPAFEKLSHPTPINPSQYKTREEFLFAVERENMKALAYSEVLNFFTGQKAAIQRMRIQVQQLKAYGKKTPSTTR